MSTVLTRGNQAAWASTNPILADGVFGFEIDTGRIKIGDGVSRWATLPYYTTGLNSLQVSTLQGVASSSSGTPTAGPTSTFVFSQLAPITVWTIQHNLGRFPDVTVIDSTGAEVEGDVVYIDNNNLTITFSVAFAGTAYLN